MKHSKPIASLSFDLDDKWTYMKTHGDAGWETFPSYFDIVVPRVLQFLKERNLTITFFIVGQDAALEKNHDLLQSIANAGHEIGNHSFKHEPWLHLYNEKEIEKEITAAEESIEKATGKKPVGFRGPGFSLSNTTLEQLVKRGYEYDASTYPNIIMPVARSFFLMNSKFTLEQKQQRKALGGTLRDGFRSLKPYTWQTENGKLIEIPVTTMPIFKLPIHVSYLICLAVLSPSLARLYFKWSLYLCQFTSTQPSLLLHPTDFLGCEDSSDLSFFPGMKLPIEKKIAMVTEITNMLCAYFTIGTLRQFAFEVTCLSNLPIVEPKFLVHK